MLELGIKEQAITSVEDYNTKISIKARQSIMIVGAFILRSRIMCIIYIVVTVAPCSFSKRCGSSKDDDKLVHYFTDTAVIPLESYCFVNECTIRIKESRVPLTVINETENWIIATNTTNLFTTFFNGSINNCSSDPYSFPNLFQFDMILYVIHMGIYCVGILVGVANISMHLIFKELRTVSGILIILHCISSISVLLLTGIAVTIYYYQVTTSGEICAIFFHYLFTVTANIYEATRITVLAHFVYTMHRSYKLLGSKENEKSMICKYITFIIGATTVSSTVVILVDVTVNRKAFDTKDGQCINFFDREGMLQLSMSNVLYFVITVLWFLIQVTLLIIALVLYILTTKQCCAASKSRDFRVSIILMAIVDMNIIIFVVLLVINFSVLNTGLIIAVCVVIEQVALFALFGSSSKVMCCSMKEEKVYKLNA